MATQTLRTDRVRDDKEAREETVVSRSRRLAERASEFATDRYVLAFKGLARK
jgi:hypothetical protein